MGTDKNIKIHLLDICKSKQLETIANLKREMDEHQQMANDYGPPKDRYDAFRSQMLRRRDIFAEQLQKANEELIMLNRIPAGQINQTVEFGSVVITNQQKLFISISLGKIVFDNEMYYCISPAVPVFKAMTGFRKGDTCNFNNTLIQIVDVF